MVSVCQPAMMEVGEPAASSSMTRRSDHEALATGEAGARIQAREASDGDHSILSVFDYDYDDILNAPSPPSYGARRKKRSSLTRKLSRELAESFARMDDTRVEPLIPLDRLKRIRLLNTGGFASVYLVQDSPTNESYALKALHKGRLIRKKQEKNAKHERWLLGSIAAGFTQHKHNHICAQRLLAAFATTRTVHPTGGRALTPADP